MFEAGKINKSNKLLCWY